LTVANGAEVGRVGYGVLTINGGSFSENSSGNQGVILGDQTTAQGGTVNLNGGTLTTRKLSSSNGINAFNFNGGTLQAQTTNQGANFWLSSAKLTANVRNGGGTIDNNGTSITIAQPLVHSTISGDNATDGGMIFKGSSTTTLSGVNTYTGATTVNAGTLKLGATGSISSSASIALKAGTTLDTTAQSFTMLSAQPFTFTLDPSGAGSAGKISAAALNITNGSVTFSTLGTLNDASYVIATYSSLTGTAFNSVTSLPSGYYLNYNFGGTNNTIALVAVPEPREFAIAISVLLGALIFARRRQTRRCE
jgi:autotransporter-associated beta strand protein